MNKLTALQVPASPDLQQSFIKVAQSKQLHSREFLRGLITLFSNKAHLKPASLASNKILTRPHQLRRQTGGLIVPVNPDFTQKVDKLAQVLGISHEAVIINIMEFVVSTEQSRGVKS